MFRYRKELFAQLAKEYNCEPSAFEKAENLLTVSALVPGRREYSIHPYFFHMCTLGGNAVITADARLHPFLRDFMAEKEGHWLFELKNILILERELSRFGYTFGQTFHMFLPAETPKADVRFPVKWFFGDEIAPFYGDMRFSNAIIQPEPDPKRPDTAVVAAYAGDTLIGMAGCSRDAENWYQIGIDVLPAYRMQGVGTMLVILLREHIEKEGGIPFYGTSVANYGSWNTALRAGFRPVWVELGAKWKSPESSRTV